MVVIDFPALIAANPQQPTGEVTPAFLIEMVNGTDSLLDYGQYRYATLGFVLVGQILEEVYGISYETLFRQKLIDKLDLEGIKLSKFSQNQVIQGYSPEGSEQEAFVWNCVASAGLVKSSTADMLSYVAAILSDDSAIAAAAKLQEKAFYEHEKRTIGLGINIMPIGESTLYAKTGDTMGQSSLLAYDRERGLGLIICVNQRNSKLRNQIFNEMYEVLYP